MYEIAKSFPSLEPFCAADSRRRYSRECDIGLLWRAARGATFRAVCGRSESLSWFLDRTVGARPAAA